jgi:hypothetical protein
MSEHVVRKGEEYEVIATESSYQVWQSESREGMPLAQFKLGTAGLQFAIQYFRQMETEASTANTVDLPVSPPPEGSPSPHISRPTSFPSVEEEDSSGRPPSGDGGPLQTAPASQAAAPPSPPIPPRSQRQHLASIALPFWTSDPDSLPPQPRQLSRPGRIWAAVAGTVLVAGIAGGITYAATSTSSVGCGSLRLAAHVPSPLYAGSEFKERVVTSCDAQAYVRFLQTDNNPTFQAGSGWGTPYNLDTTYVGWEEDTQGLAHGTYHWLAQLRVVGQKRIATSPVLTFTILPKPFDLGNPAANDVAIGNAIQAACTEDGYYESSTNTGPAATETSLAGCEQAAVAGINQARAQESLPAEALPSDFWTLPYDQQLFVLIDLERVSRNLPPFVGIGPSLDADASSGAQAQTDPPLNVSYASDNFGGWVERSTTVYAVFDWVYDDGVVNSNGDGSSGCAVITDATCWGHRDGILHQFGAFGPRQGYSPADPLQFGAACVSIPEAGWIANLSCTWEGGAAAPSAFTYTWAEAVTAGAAP